MSVELSTVCVEPSYVIIYINGVKYNRILGGGADLESLEQKQLIVGHIRILYFDFGDTDATFEIRVVSCNKIVQGYHIIWGCLPSETYSENVDKSYKLINLIKRLI